MEKLIRRIAVATGIFLMGIMGIVGFYSYTLPDSFYVSGGEPLNVSSLFSISSRHCKNQTYYTAASGSDYINTAYTQNISNITNISDSTLMLFDTVPIKPIKEKTVSRPFLVPCGQPFGIKLMTDGVMIISFEKTNGYCPASDCGLKVGDIIISVNNQKVDSNKKISEIISSSKGGPCVIKYRRNNEDKTATLTPILYDGTYKGGMWVRDSSAGIGTLTFYDPETSTFGGLGHPICDSDTKVALPLSQGSVGEVDITGYNKSINGQPGQLLGEFTSSAKTGSILANSDSGIFGTLFTKPGNTQAIPLGFRHEVHTGEAKIYATINGSQPKEYSIEIENIDLHDDAEHDMIIRVTDKKLLKKTGGIVQGMSGSPIIQDGKLIGAVTHVFIDSPQQGYAIFADSMYEQSCICSDLASKTAG